MSSKKDENLFDFIILGAGGTGLAAAMYGARLNLKTLVLGHSHGSEMPVGGVITTTNVVENYPGFIRLSGPELAENLEKHARDYELVTIKEEKATDIHRDEQTNLFIVKTKEGEYCGKTILFATGTKWKKLPETIKGGREYENKGVAYCALCDAPLFKNKIVCVIGGSDSAAKDALVLAEHASKVYIIYRGEKIRPEPINYERVMKNSKIEVINNTNITEVLGEHFVQKVKLDKPYNGKDELEVQGVFVAIGHEVLSDLAIKLGVEVDNKKQIKIDHKTSETNLPGVFAAGDVADKPFKQLITGVAEGCTAAYSAHQYITKSLIQPY